MTTRDKIRLVRLNEQILESEAELDEALKAEFLAEELGSKKFFKRSKAISYKLKRLLKMRTNLNRSSSQRLTTAQTYDIVLADRIAVSEAAAKRVKDFEAGFANLFASYSIQPTVEKLEEIKLQKAELRSLKIIATNKERKVSNWLAKEEWAKKTAKKLKAEAGELSPAKKIQISANIYKTLNSSNESIEPDEIEIKTPESILGFDPNWESTPLNNTASFDLFKSSPLTASNKAEVQTEPKVCPTIEQFNINNNINEIVSKPRIVVDI